MNVKKNPLTCDQCGNQSRPVAVDSTGQCNFWDLPRGWSVAPYPSDYIHPNGSRGDLYVCPRCNKH
jgi:hypothetical protein